MGTAADHGIKRFLHARLTLFRPALTMLCKAPCDVAEGACENETGFTSIRKEMVIKAANLCLSSANALVDVMTTNMDPSAERLPAPWYNVFCRLRKFVLASPFKMAILNTSSY